MDFVHSKEKYANQVKFITRIQILANVLLVHLMDQEIFANAQVAQLPLLTIVDNIPQMVVSVLHPTIAHHHILQIQVTIRHVNVLNQFQLVLVLLV